MSNTTNVPLHPRTSFAQVGEPRACQHTPERPGAAPERGHCQHEGCGAPARPVYLEAGGEPIGWYCTAHMSTAGFCNGCGVYVADRPEHRVTWAFYGRCQACTEDLLG